MSDLNSSKRRVSTFDDAGNVNGYVILCWNALEDPDERPDQVYVTAIAPGCHKGPHLHKVRCGRFICIKGNVRIVTRTKSEDWPQADREDALHIPHPPKYEYATHFSGDLHGYNRITVPPGIAACIYNDSNGEEALMINMPTPAWSKEQPDEWPVEDWDA